MNPNSDAYEITVEGIYNHSIRPQKVDDIGRVTVNIRRDGVIKGDVLCGNLNIQGRPATIDGGVLARKSVNVQGHSGLAVVKGPMAASGSILVEAGGQEFTTTTRIVGDVSGPSVRMKGAFVYGNVMGDQVKLEQCVVLGIVHARESLVFESSLALSFLAGKASVVGDRNLILLFAAAATSKLTLTGRIHAIPHFTWNARSKTQERRAALLTNEDIRKLAVERGDSSSENLLLLSCYDRVVSMKEIEASMTENVSWLENFMIRIYTEFSLRNGSGTNTGENEVLDHEFKEVEDSFWRMLRPPSRNSPGPSLKDTPAAPA